MQKILQYLLIFLAVAGVSVARGQERPPVKVTTVMGLPYTPFLADYYAVNSSNLQATVLFTDLTESSLQVYLSIKINSASVKLESKPTFRPTSPLTIYPGQATVIKGSDLSVYFDFNNLNLTGITQAALQQTGALPEGNYNFCIEVREYNTGRLVSNQSCAFANISLAEPPLILLPRDATTETPKSPQNIVFQWQLRTIPPGGYTNVEYILKLYEITDPSVNPKTAVLNNQALKIYESTLAIQSSTFIYDVNATLLQVGKRYAFTVQAKDKQNRASFKNNGVSEVFWFRYGMSTNGKITLKAPADEGGFALYQTTAFQWSAPDNLENNMGIKYKLKIAKLDGKSPQNALLQNTALVDYTSSETFSNADVYHTITESLERMEDYAWQVTAEASGVQIAASEIFTFSGPPLLGRFIAGNEQIKVIKTYNRDMTALNGKAEVKYDNTTNVIFEFKNVNLANSGGEWVMASGEIVAPFVTKPEPITVTPEYADNGNAYFHPDSIKFTTQKYYLGGVMKWDLPHAVNGSAKGVVTSNHTYMVYSNYKLIGSATLNDNNDFELMDPMNFRIKLFKDQSDFLVSSNQFRFRLYGEVYVNSNVKSRENKRIAFEFEDKRDLFYFDMSTLMKTNNQLPLISKANVYAVPKKWILDLSEKVSPQRHTSNKEWKGLYYEDFDVEYYTDVDASKQLSFNSKLTHTYNLTSNTNVKMWIDSKGLQAKVYRQITASEDAKFNQFPATLKDFNIDVENSASTGKVTGSVLIPFLHATTPFDFSLPLNNDGFQTGSFDKSLDNYELVYNPAGGEQVMNVKVIRAVFADNERLDCTVDIGIPALKVEFKSINNFRIYGDMFIGFSKRNGSYNLPSQKRATYKQWTINIDKLGASLVAGNYALSYSGTMPLGQDVAGKSGPPRIEMSSTTVPPAAEGVSLSSGDYSSAKGEIPVTIKSDAKKDEFAFEPLELKFRSSIVEMDGYLEVRNGDPVWGTCFKGGLNGKLLIPSRIDMGANMILGNTNDQLKYWYFDAYFNDTEGQGVKVFNFFNIVALEGRVYRHMKQNLKTKEFEINKDVSFGAGIYTQLIDPNAGGKVFKSDIGAEIEVVSGDFTVQVQGDIAVFNATGRDKSGAAALKKKAAEEMAKEAAKQAAKALGDLNVEIPIGSDKLKLRGGASVAGMTYITGSTEVGFLGEISSTPAATLTYKSGSDLVSIKGDVQGAVDMTFKKGSDQFAMEFNGTDKGKMDLTVGSLTFGAGFDQSLKAGELKIGYDSKLIKLTGNKTSGEGSLLLKYDATKQFSASLSSAGKASMGILYGDFSLSMAGDKTNGSGHIGFRLNSDTLYAGVNKSKGEGQLYTQISGHTVDAYASANGGKIQYAKDGKSYLLEADRTDGTGKIELIPGANEKYALEIAKSGRGSLLLQNSTFTLSLGADKASGAGDFFLNTGNTTLKGGANKSAGTGYAGYRNGSDSIWANLKSSTSFEFATHFSGTALGFDLDASGQGNMLFKNSTLSLYAGANKTAKSGYFGFKKGQDSVYTMIDATAKKGSFYLGLSGKTINATAEATKGSLTMIDGSKELNLEADVENGVGSLEVKPNSTDRYFLELEKAGNGKLELKNSSIDLRISASKNAGSGDFYLDVANKVFRGGANKTASTGYAGYRNGSDSIFAAVKSATEFEFASNFSGNSLLFDVSSAGQGNLSFINSNLSLYAGANKTAKTGYFGFKKSQDSLYTMIDATAKKGSFYLGLSGKTINATAEATKGSLTMIDGSKELKLEADVDNGVGSLEVKPNSTDRYFLELEKVGNGKLELKNSSIDLRISASKNVGSGDFYLDVSNKVFRGGANKTVGTGYAGYRNGSDSIFAAVKSATEFEFASNFSGNSLLFDVSSAGQGNLSFINSNLSLYAGANKTAKTGYFGFKKSQDSLYTMIDATAKKGSFYLGLSGKTIDATAEATKGSLTMIDGSKELKLEADVDNGVGSLEVKPNSTDRYFLALEASGNGKLELKNSTLDMRISASKNVGSGDFYLETNNKIFRGCANKTGGTGYAGYRNGSDSLFADLSSSAIALRFNFSNTFFGIDANKNGQGTLDFRNSTNFFRLSGDVTQKTGSFAVGLGTNKFYLDGNADAGTGSVGIKTSSDSLYAEKGTSSAKFYMNTGNLLVDVDGNTNGTASLKAAYGGRSLEVDGNVNTGAAAIEYAESGLTLSLNSATKVFEFQSGSSTVKVEFGTSIQYYEGTTLVSLNFTNGQGTFTKTYNGKSIEFTVTSSEKYFKIANGSDYAEVTFDNSYNGSAEFKYNGNLYKAEKDGSGNYLVQYNTKIARLNVNKSLELLDGSNRRLKISTDGLEANYDAYALEIDATAKKCTYSDQNYEAEISSAKLYLKNGTKSLTIKSDKSAEFVDGTANKLSVSTSGVDFKYGDYAASFDNQKNLSFTDGTRSFAFNGSVMEATQGSFALKVKPDATAPLLQVIEGTNELKITKDEGLLKVGNNSLKFVKDSKLEVTYGTYALTVEPEKGTYSDGTYSVEVGGTNLLKVADNSKSFTISSDNAVRFINGTTTDIQLDKDGIDFKYDTYTASFNKQKNLSYSDGTRSFSFNGGMLEATEGNFALKVKPDATAPLLQVIEGTNELKITKDEGLLKVGNNSLKFVKDSKLEITYGTYALTVEPEKGTYSDGTYSVEVGGTNLLKVADNSKSFTISSDNAVRFINGTTTDIQLNKDGIDFKYDTYTASFNKQKNLSYSDGTRSFTFNGGTLEATEGSFALKVKADAASPLLQVTEGSNELKITKDEGLLKVGNNSMKFVKGNKLEVVYSNYNLTVESEKGSYSDGTYTVLVGGDQLLKVNDATKTFLISNDQAVSYKDGTKTDITLSKDGVDFKYDKYAAGFNKTKSLNFSDGTRSFEFTTTKVEMSEGTKKLTLVTDASNPSIELTDGTNMLKMSKQEAELKYGDKSMKIDKDAKLTVDYSGHKLEVDKEKATYSKGSLSAGVGGDNIVFVSEGTRSLTFDKTYNLTAKDGSYIAKIGSDKTFSLTDGTQTLSIGGDNLIAYDKSDLKLALFKGSLGYGIRSEYNSYKVSVEAGKGKSAKVTAEHSSMGELQFSGNLSGDMTVGYKKGSDDLYVDAGKKDFKVYGSMAESLKSKLGGGTASDPNYIGGSSGPAMSGPKYLGDKITKGEGMIKGKISMYYNSKADHLLVNGAVSGAKPVCINGAFLIEQKKGAWKVMIGEKTKYIEIYPTCSGFGGEGYFYYDPKQVEFYAQGGWRFHESVGIGIASIVGRAYMNLGIGAAAELDPFKMKSATIQASMGASLDVEYDFLIYSGSFNIASANLRGQLTADFEKSTLSGSLAGNVSICGMGKSFNMSFERTI